MTGIHCSHLERGSILCQTAERDRASGSSVIPKSHTHLPIRFATKPLVKTRHCTLRKSGTNAFLHEVKGKVVPVLFLTKHRAMKAYWGSGGIAPLILCPGQFDRPQYVQKS
jgi:hypothetical protein